MAKIRLLFQGDSITDAGRNRLSRESLAGYPEKTARLLKEKFGNKKFKFFNRGIGGDRSKNLLQRYRKHFLKIRPDIVTVMIGINDVWRGFDRRDYTSPATYEKNLIELFTKIKKDTGAKIIVLSPYLTPNDKHDEMRTEVNYFIGVCEKVAGMYADAFINTDIPMNLGVAAYGKKEISADGVHPAEEGQKILAKLLADKIAEMV